MIPGEDTPLLESGASHSIQQSDRDHNALQNCSRGCCCCISKFCILDLFKSLHVLLISLLTDWPWKIIAAFYASDKDIPKPNCLTTCIRSIFFILRFLLIIVAMVTKDIASFRRDRLDNTSSSGASFPVPPLNLYKAFDPPENATRANESTTVISAANITGPAAYKTLKLFGEIIILDLITIILLIWVLYKYFRSLHKRNQDPVAAVEAGNGTTENSVAAVEVVNEPTENPNAAAEDGIEPAENPVAAVEVVNKPTENPNAAAEDGIEPAENPVAAVEVVNKPTENPNAAAEDGIEPAENPVAAVEVVNKPTENPNAAAEDGIEPAENPVAVAEAGNVVRRNEYSLMQLIDKVNEMQTGNKSCSMIYTKILSIIIPVSYVIYSAGVSAMYLSVYFKRTEVIWPEEWKITGCLKAVVIITLLVSTTAVDLLYIQIVIRYILRCRLNIHFLQLITEKIEVKSNKVYKNQEQYLELARGFLKKLNKKRIVELAIIYGLIQAINTAINLSNDMKDSNKNAKPHFREFALICSLIGWIFLMMAPIHWASKVNEESETLCDTIYKYPIMFIENTPSQTSLTEKNVSKIVLNANCKLFNLTIHPGFIRLAIMGILLFFAVKSGLRLFENAL